MQTTPVQESDPPVLAEGPTIREVLESNGMARRDFLRYCGFLTAALALPQLPYREAVAAALTAKPRVPVLWLNGQDCNGNIESLIRSGSPTPSELLLDHLAVNYVELLMAAAGSAAERSRTATIAKGGYVLVVEGGIPTGASGAYCTVGGRAFTDIVREAAGKAAKVISVGTCASWGGVPAARGGVTGAVDLQTFLGPSKRIIRLPGCPVNAVNVVGTIVHFITFGKWPSVNQNGLPFFAYGEEIHEDCPRKDYYEDGKFVLAWGDEGHQKGWCLRKMGCRGPETRANCREKKFNGGTSYNIASGAPCYGCVLPKFWDAPGGLIQALPADDEGDDD